MTNVSKYYKVDGNKVERTHRICSKCGPGYFLADHYDRWSCGKCGYTMFKRKGKKTTRTSPQTTRRTTRRSPRKRVKSQ